LRDASCEAQNPAKFQPHQPGLPVTAPDLAAFADRGNSDGWTGTHPAGAMILAGKTYRRIAQWQSTSIHAEGAAAFDSCSAYHPSPRILFLSHCVPYPPDKGDRIRAYRDLMRLAAIGPVHLACFTRNREEEEGVVPLRSCCASMYLARFNPRTSLLSAA